MGKFEKLDVARAHLERALSILDGENGRSASAYLVELALEHLKPGADDDAGERLRIAAADLVPIG